VEVLVKELGSEFGVEGSAVGNKGACLSDITDKSLLKRFELICVLHPSDFVVLERVDKSVSLVHLLSSFGCLLLEGVLFSHLSIEFLS